MVEAKQINNWVVNINNVFYKLIQKKSISACRTNLEEHIKQSLWSYQPLNSFWNNIPQEWKLNTK